jgi:hypothetical protein
LAVISDEIQPEIADSGAVDRIGQRRFAGQNAPGSAITQSGIATDESGIGPLMGGSAPSLETG